MLQKTTWILYLIIGISFIFSSCKKDEGNEPLQKADYIFKNTISDLIRFELYKSENSSSIEYEIEKGDSIIFYFSGNPGVYPFTGSEASNRSGDSVVIRFQDEKCISYKRNQNSGTFGGDGVFDLTEYDNYSQDLVNQKSYTLLYSIDSIDYKRATICK